MKRITIVVLCCLLLAVGAAAQSPKVTDTPEVTESPKVTETPQPTQTPETTEETPTQTPTETTETPSKTETEDEAVQSINVAQILQKSPDSVDEKKVDLLRENLEQLSGEQRRKAEEWLLWAAGGQQPEWSDVITADAENVVDARRADDDVDVLVQIREGQYVTNIDWYTGNDTAHVSVYSEYAGRIAFADANDISETESSKITVTNAELQADAVTTIQVSATSDSGDQSLYLNSFRNNELRLISLTNQQTSRYIPRGTDDAVAIGLGSLAGLSAFISIAVYRRRKQENEPEEVI
jgi:hypothetical protein